MVEHTPLPLENVHPIFQNAEPWQVYLAWLRRAANQQEQVAVSQADYEQLEAAAEMNAVYLQASVPYLLGDGERVASLTRRLPTTTGGVLMAALRQMVVILETKKVYFSPPEEIASKLGKFALVAVPGEAIDVMHAIAADKKTDVLSVADAAARTSYPNHEEILQSFGLNADRVFSAYTAEDRQTFEPVDVPVEYSIEKTAKIIQFRLPDAPAG